jgi:hypothetical protein
MRFDQEAHMMDTCLIAEPTSTEDDYNNEVETFTWASAPQEVCGFNGNPSREVLNQVPTSEAIVRVPITRTISNRARVRITKRFGETEASPITYEVVGMPRSGPSGKLVWLKKVTDGS